MRRLYFASVMPLRSPIAITATSIMVHRLDAGRVVVSVIVGDDGRIRWDRIGVRPRTHIRVRLDDAVSGRVAVAGVGVVRATTTGRETGSSEQAQYS